MITQTAVLYLCKVIKKNTALDGLDWPDNNILGQYKQRSLAAAQDIAKLSRFFCQQSFFQVGAL